jgi:hypothetical protein
MAYDAATGTVVLIGGNNGSTQYTDIWLWHGINWTQVFPAVSPTTRQGANMAYDPSIGAVVLFGGCNEVWENSLNDTWIWNGTTWKQIQTRYPFRPTGTGSLLITMPLPKSW